MSIADGAVTEFPLPDGYSLPSSGARISPGPAVPGSGATGELFFTASASGTSLGSAAIGEVSGIPLPVVPGSLIFKPSVSVSKQRVAKLSVMCVGVANAECAGKMTLSVRAKVQVEQQVRAARKGVNAEFRSAIATKSLKLGSVTYEIRGGITSRPSVTLSSAAYRVLEQVSGHKWTATVTNSPTVGVFTGNALAMTGPDPQKLKPTQASGSRTGGSATRKLARKPKTRINAK